MKTLLILAATIAAGAPSYHVDLGRYFTDASAEQASRTSLLAEVDTFAKTPRAQIVTPRALTHWLATYGQLMIQLRKHDAYVYLLAEKDSGDHADEAACAALDSAIARVTRVVENMLVAIGRKRLNVLMTGEPVLARYKYFIDTTLEQATHAARNKDAITALAEPALRSLSTSYKSLLPPSPKATDDSPEAKFAARWQPFAQNEAAFAALLLPIVHLRDGEARLEGYSGAPEATYSEAGLTNSEVNDTLAAIRGTDAAKRFDAVITAAAARRLGVAPDAVHAWDLQAADAHLPPSIALPDAIPLILAAEQSMGQDYAGHYAQLFDPRAHRIEWCREEHCDHTGFSLGYAGVDSVLFYGDYHGDTDSIRAVAHEAGHAVHREFMNENQKVAPYNSGPRFLFESFSIFNELLLLEHLYRSTSTPETKAFYLRQFLEDATFQIYGSAQETDLEQSIYAGVRAGTLHGAADIDNLTLTVFAQYRSGARLDPRMRVYWARNRLFFVDPLYDVNYLFAGLLAVEYLRQYEADPAGFPGRYVSLLKNGFTDSPQSLEKHFLGIDLDNPAALVRGAATLIDQRSEILQALYQR